MPLNVGTPMGSSEYSASNTQNAYANAYGTATTAATSATPGKTSYRYPLKRLDSSSDFLEIKIFDYVASSSFASPGTNTTLLSPSKTAQERLAPYQQNPKYYINLPIPQSIADITSITWGEDTLNPLQMSLLNLGQGVAQKGLGAYQDVIETLKTLPNLAQNQRDALTAYVNARAINLANANVSPENIISRATGQVLQTNLELLFQGVSLRAFPFVFDLAPRSRAEAQEVKDIIRILKKTMSAKGRIGDGQNSFTGLFIGSPSLYQLTYRSGSGPHPFLHKFKPCALSDISVNYTGSNTYATYADGTPVHMQMSLTFKEINPVYAEDYETPEAGDGVGY